MCWVDKNWDKIHEKFHVKVSSPSELLKVKFDMLVIAVIGKNVAEEIRAELINVGIDESKIKWKDVRG